MLILGEVMRMLSGKIVSMGYKKYKPEPRKRKVRSGMPGSYYASLSRNETDGVWKSVTPRLSPAELEAQRLRCRRKRLIREAVEKVQK